MSEKKREKLHVGQFGRQHFTMLPSVVLERTEEQKTWPIEKLTTGQRITVLKPIDASGGVREFVFTPAVESPNLQGLVEQFLRSLANVLELKGAAGYEHAVSVENGQCVVTLRQPQTGDPALLREIVAAFRAFGFVETWTAP